MLTNPVGPSAVRWGPWVTRGGRSEVRVAALLCQARWRNLESPVLGHWREAEERSGRSTGGVVAEK